MIDFSSSFDWCLVRFYWFCWSEAHCCFFLFCSLDQCWQFTLKMKFLKYWHMAAFLWLPPLLRRLNRRCDERYSPTYFRLNHWRQGAKSFKPDWPLIGLKVRPPSHHPGSAGADLLSLGDASSSMSPKSFYLRIFFTLDKPHESTSIWCLIWLNSSF